MSVDDIFNDDCEEEQILDQDLTAYASDEENSDRTWYPSESELDNLEEGEEATGNF